MKHIKKLAFLMIVALAMASCNLLNVDVDTEFTGILDIEVEEGMKKGTLETLHPFSAETTLNPRNDEVEPYVDNINSVEVGTITAKVNYVSEENVVVKKGAKFTVSGIVDTEWILAEDWPIITDDVRVIEDQDGFYGDVSKILGEIKDFDIKLEGKSTQSGVFIKLEFSIDAVVKGSVF